MIVIAYQKLTRTSLEFFSRTKTDGSRSSQSKKGNEIQVSLLSLLTHCSKLVQTCTHSCKNTRLQVSFPYYFELAPFKDINSSYQQERMSSFSLAISSISEQCILPFFYRRLDRLCLSLQYLNCDQVYFHMERESWGRSEDLITGYILLHALQHYAGKSFKTKFFSYGQV